MPKCKICYMLQPISYAGFVPQLYKKTTNVFFQANQKHLKHYECGRFPPKNTFKSFLLHYTEKCTRTAFLGVFVLFVGWFISPRSKLPKQHMSKKLLFKNILCQSYLNSFGCEYVPTSDQ